MNTLDFLAGLGRASLAAAVLAVLVLAAQQVFRKILTPHWRCALWLLVLARLLPISLSSDVSVFNLFPTWATGPVSATALAGVEISSADSLQENRKNEPLPASTWKGQIHAVSAYQLWIPTLFYMWLAGVFILAGYTLARALRFRRALALLKPFEDRETRELLTECCRTMGVRHQPVIFETKLVDAPALYGCWRPRLLLPEGFIHAFSRSELRFVFLHELAHVRRGDLPLQWLMTAVQIIHWFNPLLWFAFARWRCDREIACDAAAIEATGTDSKLAYGRTILRILDSLARPRNHPSLVSIASGNSQLKQRITMIGKFEPPRRKYIAIAILGLLGSLGLTDAQVDAPQSPLPDNPPPRETQPETTASAQTNTSPSPAQSSDTRSLTREEIDHVLVDEITTRFGGDRSKFLAYLRAEGKTIRQYRREIEEKVLSGELQLPGRSTTDETSRFEERVHLRLIQLQRKPAETDEALLARANPIMMRLRAGVSFAELAREYSDDMRRARGGDWGWQKREDLREGFGERLFQLKSGEASAPIVTPEACFILFVEDRRLVPGPPVEKPLINLLRRNVN